MADPAPVSVGIPTRARGERVFQPIERILAGNPVPSEILVHVDAAQGEVEAALAKRFPNVRVLASPRCVGPGGGRHRMLHACTQPYFASFDDDSWPRDADFFGRVLSRFEAEPDVAVLTGEVTIVGMPEPPRRDAVVEQVDFSGCGHAIRVSAYRGIPGYVDRPCAYGLEEKDVALQLHAAGWRILKCWDLPVTHETDIALLSSAEVTTATIENAALLPWLRYPATLWPYGMLQYVNAVGFLIAKRRFPGLLTGLLASPIEIWRHRSLRRPLDARAVRSFLRARKKGGKNGR